MRQSYLPSKDSDLLAWSANFAGGVLASAEELGVPLQRAEELVAAQLAFAEAMRAVSNPAERTGSGTLRKNERREELKAAIRPIAELIQAQPDVTDEQRYALGLTIRKKGRSRVGPPEEAPVVRILGVKGRTVTVELRQQVAERRGRPMRTAGAMVYVAAGERAPVQEQGWTCRFIAKTTAELTVDAEPGSVVHVTARWVNRRGETGPAAQAARTHVQFGWGNARLGLAA